MQSTQSLYRITVATGSFIATNIALFFVFFFFLVDFHFFYNNFFFFRLLLLSSWSLGDTFVGTRWRESVAVVVGVTGHL
jgi:hypothetical protein